MKKVNYLSIAAFFLFFACNKENQKQTSEDSNSDVNVSIQDGSLEDQISLKRYTFDKLFEAVTAAEISYTKDEALYLRYSWDKTSDIINIESVEKKELDFFPFTSEFNNKAGEYTVSCSGGDNDGDEGDCDGAVSCGKLIKACLDGGGCATVCVGYLIYVPEINTFYSTVDI